MDEALRHILENQQVLGPLIGAAITAAVSAIKGKLNRKDKKAIKEVTDRMVQAATLEDVHRYDPRVRELDEFQAKAFLEDLAGGEPGRGVVKKSRKRVVAASAQKSSKPAAKKITRKASVTKKRSTKRRAH